ncbi:CHAT domain-containing protein [Nocardia sp. A7]|uniref:CHAT domain-containing protein n=1 Tax=Nocardia sp. A7 TaxID=2789274 RepID=UPI00397BBB1E
MAYAHGAAGAPLVLGAALRRNSIPRPWSNDVFLAVSATFVDYGSSLSEYDQADLGVRLHFDGLALGFSGYADLLRATDLALSIVDGEGEGKSRRSARIRHLGYRAAALLELGDHEQAGELLAQAEGALGLDPIPPLGQPVMDTAVDRLAAGVMTPVLVIKAIANTEDLVLWIRQLQADVAGRADDLVTAVALYQSLWQPYGSHGWALVVNAAACLIESENFGSARRVIDYLSGTEHWSSVLPHAALVAGFAAIGAGQVREASGYAESLSESITADLVGDLHLLRARIAKAEDKVEEAAACYLAAVRAKLEPRRAALDHPHDSTSMREIIPIADEAIAYLADNDHAADILRVGDSVKASRLRAILARPRRDDGAIVPKPLEQQGNRIRAELRAEQDHLDEQLARMDRRDIENSGLDTTDFQQRAQLRQERQASRNKSLLYDPAWTAMTDATTLDVAALQRRCGDSGTAAIAVYRCRERIVTVLVDGAGLELGSATLAPEIVSALDTYTSNLADSRPVREWFDPDMLGLRLDQFVPAHLIERAGNASAVVIAAHRQLHLIPWALMRCNHEGARFVERVAVAVTPNLDCLQYLDFVVSPIGLLGLFGPPAPAIPSLALPAGVNERDAIAETFGSARIGATLAGASATSTALLEILQRQDISGIHLISHGRVAIDDPLSCCFIVADGRVDAAALLDIDIAPAEMFASACSIGWRPNSIGAQDLLGDEALALPGALLTSGIRALVVSTAPIGDQASAFLAGAYHRQRSAGLHPIHALRAAQLLALQSQEFPVQDWCCMTIYGSAFAQTPPDKEISWQHDDRFISD